MCRFPNATGGCLDLGYAELVDLRDGIRRRTANWGQWEDEVLVFQAKESSNSM